MPPGGSVEPVVSPGQLLNALADEAVERFRALLPVGYAAAADAYRTAVEGLTAESLSTHYTDGLTFFHETFVPALAGRITDLTGGVWDLSGHVAYAAGSDVDFMTHLVEAVAARGPPPSSWATGSASGSARRTRTRSTGMPPAEVPWPASASPRQRTAPDRGDDHISSRRGRLSPQPEPVSNPGPSGTSADGPRLLGLLNRSVLSISFSRGFRPYRLATRCALRTSRPSFAAGSPLNGTGSPIFHNALAARAFLAARPPRLESVDRLRRAHVADRLETRGLPSVATGATTSGPSALKARSARPDPPLGP